MPPTKTPRSRLNTHERALMEAVYEREGIDAHNRAFLDAGLRRGWGECLDALKGALSPEERKLAFAAFLYGMQAGTTVMTDKFAELQRGPTLSPVSIGDYLKRPPDESSTDS